MTPFQADIAMRQQIRVTTTEKNETRRGTIDRIEGNRAHVIWLGRPNTWNRIDRLRFLYPEE